MQLLNPNLAKTQMRMRSLVEAHRQDHQFARISPKLSKHFFGQNKIITIPDYQNHQYKCIWDFLTPTITHSPCFSCAKAQIVQRSTPTSFFKFGPWGGSHTHWSSAPCITCSHFMQSPWVPKDLTLQEPSCEDVGMIKKMLSPLQS